MCGEPTFKSRRRSFIPLTRECFELHFGCEVGDPYKSWAPHICCVPCVRLLIGWVNVTRQMPFALSTVWREPKDHSPNCYLCLTNITGITSKSKRTVKYPDFPFAMRPVRHTRCPYQSLRKIWLLAMTTLILIKITDSKKEAMLNAIRHLKQVVLHMNPNEVLMNLSVEFSLLKKKQKQTS